MRGALLRMVTLAMLTAGIAVTDASATTVYLGLGDSVAAGAVAPPGRGYVDRYFAYTRDPARGGIDRLANLAVPGETSDSMRRVGGQLDRAIQLIRRSSNVRVVTLDIGGNDVLNGLCPAGFGDRSCAFEANFNRILRALGTELAADPGSEKLQVMQYYNPAAGTPLGAVYDAVAFGADGRVDCAGTGADRGLRDVIACVADDRGAEVVDTYLTAQAIGPAFMGDGIHPSATGHAAIACLFEHPERAGRAAPCRVLSLTGVRRQHVLAQRAVIVAVRTQQAATVIARVRVRLPGRDLVATAEPVTIASAAPWRASVGIPLSRKATRSIRRALVDRRELSAAVTVTATDVQGTTNEARTFKVIR